MLPGAHLEFTWAALNAAQRAGLFEDADYRGVALAALAPDLIDKPLAVFAFPQANATLLFSHTLLGHALVWALALWRAGRRTLPYLLAFSGHLLADRMWGFTQTLLWPLRGWHFHKWRHVGSPQAFGRAYIDIILHEPKLRRFEVIGLALLAWVILDRRLYDRERIGQVLRHGRVAGPGEV
mgnify:CR=1 FL=1